MPVNVERHGEVWIIGADVKVGDRTIEWYWGGSGWIQAKDKAETFSTETAAATRAAELPAPEIRSVVANSTMGTAWDDSHSLSALLSRAEELIARGRFDDAAQAQALIQSVRSGDPHRAELSQRLRDLCDLADRSPLMRELKGNNGSYVLGKPLGRGGNGEVRRANGPNGEVAIKVLKQKPPADGVARFRREIETLKRLEGIPGILPLLDADTAAGTWYAMPIATSLREKLGRDATLKEIVVAMAGIANTLVQVHSQAISHRDIKPDNLYWFDGAWCLGDFGLADFENAEPLTENGAKLGPAHYIAPEMLNAAKTADGRAADIYSLGKTLWVLASGQTYPLPGAHEPMYAPASIRSFRTDNRGEMLDELVRRMTQLDPTRRPSARVVANELAILAENRAPSIAPDATSALAHLKTVLLPHFTRKEIDGRDENLAQKTANRVAAAIGELAQEIEEGTGLVPCDHYFVAPEHWRHRIAMVHEKSNGEIGCRFEVGGHTISATQLWPSMAAFP
jgi:hypothetical protein